MVDLVTSQAALRGWNHVEAPALRLERAVAESADGTHRDLKNLDLAGLWLNVHFGADDLCLVFDRESGDLFDASRDATSGGVPVIYDYAVTRTTYADARSHVGIIALLQELAEHDIASVAIGEPHGKGVAREISDAETQIDDARTSFLGNWVANRKQTMELGGIAQLLSLDDVVRRRKSPPGTTELLETREAEALDRSRQTLLDSWLAENPDLDGPADTAIRTLEQLTEKLLSMPSHRQDPSYLLDRYCWEAGAYLGFKLIEEFGGYWERIDTASGSQLRIANLGGSGLTWMPLASSVHRLQRGPLYSHDTVLAWIRNLSTAALRVIDTQA